MPADRLGQARDFLMAPHSIGGIGVVGDLAVDRFIFGSVERISPEAPVPVLFTERKVDKPGCAANVVENLCALRQEGKLSFGLDVMGVVGVDAAGAFLQETFLKSSTPRPGCESRLRVLRDPERPTILKTRFIAGSQHQLLRVDEESLAPLSSDLAARLLQEVEAALPGLRCLIVQDYAKGLFSADLMRTILQRARAQGVLTLLDPNRNTPPSWYEGGGLITPNVTEAEVLLGRGLHKGADDAEMAAATRELKVRFKLDMAIITRSAHGMTLVDRDDHVYHFPTMARAVYDVTGAGDTVVAALAAVFAAGLPAEVACIVANAAASVVVGKVGTATATPAEILAALT
jgi:D-beta-D-heptose 7-phosphate kinase/D-beta-D-heptose 1-phosphate adenosyltransferase